MQGRRADQNCVASFLLLATTALFAQEPQTPPALQPPSTQSLILSVTGRGNQIYVCQNADGIYAWKLKSPDAKLLNANGDVVGRHFAGPSWELNDGSRVFGKLVASVPAPVSGAIPWLLLTAVSHEGNGIMTKVQTVQRLETQAGAAPSEACQDANKGETVFVPYQARYNFYGTP